MSDKPEFLERLEEVAYLAIRRSVPAMQEMNADELSCKWSSRKRTAPDTALRSRSANWTRPIPPTSMTEALIAHLPWLLSALTIYSMLLAGNKRRGAWVVGLVNQMLWLIWIVLAEAYRAMGPNARASKETPNKPIAARIPKNTTMGHLLS